jgi:phospholipid/cholesterol/gamma-HCH transport system permease protein
MQPPHHGDTATGDQLVPGGCTAAAVATVAAMSAANPFTYLRPQRQAKSLMVVTGRLTLDFLGWCGELTRLFLEVCRSLASDRPRWQVFATQLYHLGYMSLPIVLVTGASMGLIMAVQAHATLVRFNAEIMAGPMVMYSMVTQLGPGMTAILVAGRVGSNIAAELGTMKVTEQVDALRTMGTNPVSYLVAPRVVALVALMPVMGILAAAAGTFGGALLLVGAWGVDAGAYWYQTEMYLRTYDVYMGIVKTPFLALLIGLIACRQGLRTAGGATGVGESCTRAVVQGCITVMCANFLLTLVVNKLWHLANL